MTVKKVKTVKTVKSAYFTDLAVLADFTDLVEVRRVELLSRKLFINGPRALVRLIFLPK